MSAYCAYAAWSRCGCSNKVTCKSRKRKRQRYRARMRTTTKAMARKVDDSATALTQVNYSRSKMGSNWSTGAGSRERGANGLRMQYELLARLFGRSGHIKLLVLRAELSSDTSELPGKAFYVPSRTRCRLFIFCNSFAAAGFYCILLAMSLLGLIVVHAKCCEWGPSQSFASSSSRSASLPTFPPLSFYDSSTLREANESVRLMHHDSKLTHPHKKAT